MHANPLQQQPPAEHRSPALCSGLAGVTGRTCWVPCRWQALPAEPGASGLPCVSVCVCVGVCVCVSVCQQRPSGPRLAFLVLHVSAYLLLLPPALGCPHGMGALRTRAPSLGPSPRGPPTALLPGLGQLTAKPPPLPFPPAAPSPCRAHMSRDCGSCGQEGGQPTRGVPSARLLPAPAEPLGPPVLPDSHTPARAVTGLP